MGQISVWLDPLPHVPILHATVSGIWSGPPASFWDNVLQSVFFILKASLSWYYGTNGKINGYKQVRLVRKSKWSLATREQFIKDVSIAACLFRLVKFVIIHDELGLFVALIVHSNVLTISLRSSNKVYTYISSRLKINSSQLAQCGGWTKNKWLLFWWLDTGSWGKISPLLRGPS